MAWWRRGHPSVKTQRPGAPCRREIQSVKLRRLPWGSLCLPRGGSSPGRRRASAQALPLPARAMHPQTTLLLQNTLPKSPQPVAYPSHAAPHAQQHGDPAPRCHLLSSSPAHPYIAPSLGMAPSPHPPFLASKKSLEHPPVPTGGFPVPRSLQDPIPGPWVRPGWKMQKRTGGEKRAGALRFPISKTPTAPRTGPVNDRRAGRPTGVRSPSLLVMVLSITLLSPSSPSQI